MNCTEFETRLHGQFAPAGLEETPDLADHAEQCAACRIALDHLRLLSDSLEVWRDAVPEVDLSGAFVLGRASKAGSLASGGLASPVAGPGAKAGASRPLAPPMQAAIVARSFAHPLRGPRTLWLMAGSLAALVVAAVLISGVGNDPADPVPNPQIAVNSDLVVDGPAVKTKPLSKPDPPTDAREPLAAPQRAVYYDLAQKAAGALNDVSAFVTSGSTSRRPPSDSEIEDSEGWIDGLEEQLRPIGRSLDDAFDFLWQAGQSADTSQS